MVKGYRKEEATSPSRIWVGRLLAECHRLNMFRGARAELGYKSSEEPTRNDNLCARLPEEPLPKQI